MQVYESSTLPPDTDTISAVYDSATAPATALAPRPLLSCYFTFSARALRTGKAMYVLSCPVLPYTL